MQKEKMSYSETQKASFRRIVIDWLWEITDDARAVYLAVMLFDAEFYSRHIEKKNIQLVACACLIIAYKLVDDLNTLGLDLIIHLSDNIFTSKDLRQEERFVFKRQFGNVFHPLLYDFVDMNNTSVAALANCALSTRFYLTHSLQETAQEIENILCCLSENKSPSSLLYLELYQHQKEISHIHGFSSIVYPWLVHYHPCNLCAQE